MVNLRRHTSKGFTLIELSIVVAMIGTLAAIAMPTLLTVQIRAKYARAASDSKTAVTQAIFYASDKNQNPGTMQALREGGYVNLGDTDPWGQPWNYSATFTDTYGPAGDGEMGVCSRGPAGAACPGWPLTAPPAEVVNGTTGFSSVYGAWQGRVN